MMYSNILSIEELEALLTPEELEVYIAEKQGRLEHELTLSPAHLLLALRELEDMVGKLTTRVEQLEYQLTQKPLQLEPEIEQVVNQDTETALFELPMLPYIETQIEPQIEPQIELQIECIFEIDQISGESANSTPSPQDSSLISRSARHRERKPSFMSKLLK